MVLLPLATLRSSPRRATTAFVVGLIGFSTLLDFRLPAKALLGNGSDPELTVVQWNAQGGGEDLQTSVSEILG